MIPFLSAAGTSFQVTKMLVELVLCPLTFIGAAEGSEIYELRSVIFHDNGTCPVSKELLNNEQRKGANSTAHSLSTRGES